MTDLGLLTLRTYIFSKSLAMDASFILMTLLSSVLYPKKLMLPYQTIDLSIMAHCTDKSSSHRTSIPYFYNSFSLYPCSLMRITTSIPFAIRSLNRDIKRGVYLYFILLQEMTMLCFVTIRSLRNGSEKVRPS